MLFEKTEIPDVVVITPRRNGDSRGYFMETFRMDLFREHIGRFEFVQDNQSLSVEAGTVRGLHFQADPMAQGKLVRCVVGELLDVVVDIRPNSPTFGRHVKVVLTSENAKQLWVPPGFAHGFCTRQVNTQISYKVTEYYSAAHDRGLLWNDPALKIDWPVNGTEARLSEKDRHQPLLNELKDNLR